jgi:hypothetical protein
MKIKMTVAALGLAMAVSAPAQAQLGPVVSPDCNVGLGVSPGFDPMPYSCLGAFDGNSDNLTTEITTFLNSQGPSVTLGNTFSSVADNAYVQSVTFGESGTFTFKEPIGGVFALSLKAGDTFSLYLFNVTPGTISSLNYVTDGAGTNTTGGPNPKTVVNDLSNWSMWIGDGGANPFCTGPDGCVEVPVPEPSSFAMMFAGLLGLGVAARRRRNA